MIFDKGFGKLLISLLIYLLVSPFIPPGSVGGMVVHAWLSVVLYLAARAVVKNSHQRSISLALLGPLLVLFWLSILKIVPFSTEGSLALFVIYYALLVYAFTRQLITSREVTRNLIAGTLCLYLVIGLFWGAAYNLLYAIDNTAFSGNLVELADVSKLHVFNYFSMVTLTTLGYGDITPQTSGAGALCQMEAIIGQFFTAVLVAWLVGMYRRPGNKPSQD